MSGILNKVVREGSSEVTLEHRLEGDERVSYVDTWEKRVLGGGERKCKSPKIPVALAE